MKHSEIRRYLGNDKLHMQEHPGGRHLHFRLKLHDSLIRFPTLVCISNGGGDDLPLKNVKGVAQALGLKPEELRISVGCQLSQHCVFIKLAWHLVQWSRQQWLEHDRSADRLRGLEAMIESAGDVLHYVIQHNGHPWRRPEQIALEPILAHLDDLQEPEALRGIAPLFLAAIGKMERIPGA